MPNDDPQPAPAAARDFVVETSAEIIKDARNYQGYSRDFAPNLEYLVRAGVRAGLRHAAEKLRDRAIAHRFSVRLDVAGWLDEAADDLEREAGQ